MIVYHTDQDGIGPSTELWKRYPRTNVALGRAGSAYEHFDHFTNAPKFTATGVDGGYGAFLDTGGTIQADPTKTGGVIAMSTSGTDNDAAGLELGSSIGGPYVIASSSGRRLWFEARVRLSSVADFALFVGLAEEALAADDTLTDDDGDLASKDFVGFHCDTAAPTSLDAVHRKAGGAATVVSAGVQTLAADTWYKLGLYYDPLAAKLYYYVDGVIVATVSDVSAATFPDGEELTPLLYIKTGEGVDKKLYVDWIKSGQLAASS